MVTKPKKPFKVFYSYAHEDQFFRNELEKHLTPLRYAGKIVTWCDRKLQPDEDWEHTLHRELHTADIILLLVSPDFICSPYCYGIEMEQAYKRHEQGKARVLPILLRPVLWKGTIISKYQVLPDGAKPISRWEDRDEAFEHIANKIDQLVESLLLSPSKQEPVQPPLFTPPTSSRQTIVEPEFALKGSVTLRKRYLIQRVLGRGGMGAVYQAKDIKRQGVMCAIKEMKLSLIPPEEKVQAIQSFKFEAKMLSLLSHPNIPTFTSFFSENQRYFLVMEYIDGYTLENVLEQRGTPFSEKQVLQWAKQLCDVLSYLHSQQPPIIFRDMKPGNVMLTHQGVIKLIDFGIARFFRSMSTTPDTQLLGTPGYAAPEQYGLAQTDERTDIYALGMTLSHLLTNHLAEKGFGVKARDIYAHNPHVSLEVARVLEKATALDPEARFKSIVELKNALLG